MQAADESLGGLRLVGQGSQRAYSMESPRESTRANPFGTLATMALGSRMLLGSTFA